MDNKKNKKIRVLVVEDEIDSQGIYSEVITLHGMESEVASEGVEALEKIEAGEYDVIVLDLLLPKKSGFEVLKEIKSYPDKYKTPKVLVFTNISNDEAFTKSKRLGADEFLLKFETEPNQLIKVIKRHV